MNEMMSGKSWPELLRQIVDIPIKRYPNDAYTDKDVKSIVATMRKRMDEAQANPQLDDPFETDSKDYQNTYDIFQRMADQRGIVID